MALFEQFPYTNFHGVNLAWILDAIRDHETRIGTLEAWKTVTDDRLDGLETRMTAAEDDIDSLETRMTAAEGDIDSLETRMTAAEGDIDSLETCCTAMQTRVPASIAADAGKVLTATGAGTAEWQSATIFVDYDADNPPDPEVYIPMIKRGQSVVLRYTASNFVYYSGRAFAVEDRTNHKGIFIADPAGHFCQMIGLLENDPHAFCAILWRKDNGTISFDMSGVYNENYYSSSYS